MGHEDLLNIHGYIDCFQIMQVTMRCQNQNKRASNVYESIFIRFFIYTNIVEMVLKLGYNNESDLKTYWTK